MQLFEDVYSGYPATLALGERVTGERSSPDVLAITERIPSQFSSTVSSRPDGSNFLVRGSVGQRNFPYARVPWVAIMDRRLTTSPERGHYLVLLFREDMTGAYLSLNQGYTQYREAFSTDAIARRRVEATARECARFLGLGAGYIAGPIDLAASGRLGRGYELGSIASKFYGRGEAIEEQRVQADLLDMLAIQDRLTARVGGNILNYLPATTDEEFQEAANALAQTNADPVLPSGPIQPPPQVEVGGRKGFTRSASMAASALRFSGYKCEIDTSHRSFTARGTNRLFVEAHHLIPMGQQKAFAHSLDVPENIVALCPNCHRFIHHGRRADVASVLARLYENRQAALLSRGLSISLDKLRSLYGETLLHDD